MAKWYQRRRDAVVNLLQSHPDDFNNCQLPVLEILIVHLCCSVHTEYQVIYLWMKIILFFSKYSGTHQVDKLIMEM